MIKQSEEGQEGISDNDTRGHVVKRVHLESGVFGPVPIHTWLAVSAKNAALNVENQVKAGQLARQRAAAMQAIVAGIVTAVAANSPRPPAPPEAKPWKKEFPADASHSTGMFREISLSVSGPAH
jgi:hypothetical protein